jgi:hypothetical protein
MVSYYGPVPVHVDESGPLADSPIDVDVVCVGQSICIGIDMVDSYRLLLEMIVLLESFE